jgi:hypothetical protein
VTTADSTVDVSVVVAVAERSEPFEAFYREYAGALAGAGLSNEFIFVVPASERALLFPLVRLRETGEPIVLLEAALNIGETGMLRSALPFCRGRAILVLPAYPSVDPAALPMLVRRLDQGVDLVGARRAAASDPLINRLQRRMVHGLVRRLVGGSFQDLGSGVRAVRKDVLEDLPLYGEFSRFLPIFAMRDGYRVEELEVPQHEAGRRVRVYAPGIYLRRLLDLMAVFFLVRFREKPIRFFGLIGALAGGLGLATLGVLGIQRLLGSPLADRPLLVVGVLLFTLGIQSVALGLIGEIIVHTGARRSRIYRLAPSRGP